MCEKLELLWFGTFFLFGVTFGLYLAMFIDFLYS